MARLHIQEVSFRPSCETTPVGFQRPGPHHGERACLLMDEAGKVVHRVSQFWSCWDHSETGSKNPLKDAISWAKENGHEVA
jgi:hypothetical protein